MRKPAIESHLESLGTGFSLGTHSTTARFLKALSEADVRYRVLVGTRYQPAYQILFFSEPKPCQSFRSCRFFGREGDRFSGRVYRFQQILEKPEMLE